MMWSRGVSSKLGWLCSYILFVCVVSDLTMWQPTVVCATFLCVGTSVLLFTRAQMGQGKPVIATFILACTAMGK